MQGFLFEIEVKPPEPVGCGYPCLPPRQPCEECRTYWAALGRETRRIEAERQPAPRPVRRPKLEGAVA